MQESRVSKLNMVLTLLFEDRHQISFVSDFAAEVTSLNFKVRE